MTARLRIAAALIVSALSPACAMEGAPTLVSGVEGGLSLEGRASGSPAAKDKPATELLAAPAEVRRPVRVVLPSPYAVQGPAARP